MTKQTFWIATTVAWGPVLGEPVVIDGLQLVVHRSWPKREGFVVTDPETGFYLAEPTPTAQEAIQVATDALQRNGGHAAFVEMQKKAIEHRKAILPEKPTYTPLEGDCFA